MGDSTTTELEERLASAEAEVETLRDQLQRLAADFDNARKRHARELEHERFEFRAELLREWLAVVDNLDRALAESDPATSGPLREGVEAIHRQALDLLSRHGATRVEAVGQPFDPERHDAVGRVPGEPAGHVMSEVEKGYLLGDRLLRAPRVFVAEGDAES